MPDYLSSAGAGPDAQPRLNKTDLLARYRQRLEMSRKWRNDALFDATWKRCIDLYRGKHFNRDDLQSKDLIAVNIAFSTINVIVPSVSVNFPKIAVNARKQDDDDKAAITEALVNYWWRHFDIKPEFTRVVKDALIVGHGWLKVGYRFHEQNQPIPPDEQQQMLDQHVGQADQFAQQNPQMAGDLPTNNDIASLLPTEKSVPVEDRPFVERVSPFNIFVDPEATCIDDMKWIAQRVIRDIEDVKRDPRFSASARKKVESDSAINSKWVDPNSDQRNKVSDDIKRVTIWEFYDLQRNTMCIFPEKGGDSFLVDPMGLPYTYGVPFVMLRNYDVPDQFYPIGELEMLEPLQHELNMARSAMLNDRKKFARKYLYRRTALSAQAINALASEKDNTLVPIEDDSAPLNDVVVPLGQNSVDPQMYQLSEVIEADFDRVSGVNEYMRGSAPDIRRTATEASLIQDAANSRAADKLATVEDCIRHVAERLVQLAQQYMTTDQAIRVAGAMGQTWVNIQPHDIQGEYDFEVEAGSTQPHNEMFRRQQALDLFNAVGPYMGFLVDPSKVLVKVLQDGFGIKDPQSLMIQTPYPKIPTQKILETINYKDAPPDVQRQIEAQAGLMPSILPTPEPQVQDAANKAKQDGAKTQPPAANTTTADAAQQQSQPQPQPQDGGIPPQILAQLAGQTQLPPPQAPARY